MFINTIRVLLWLKTFNIRRKVCVRFSSFRYIVLILCARDHFKIFNEIMYIFCTIIIAQTYALVVYYNRFQPVFINRQRINWWIGLLLIACTIPRRTTLVNVPKVINWWPDIFTLIWAFGEGFFDDCWSCWVSLLSTSEPNNWTNLFLIELTN